MKLARKLLIVVLLILTIIRILLPVAALKGINYALQNKSEDYTGDLKDLDLGILRGRIAFNNLHIERKDKPKALWVDVEYASINWSWAKLWDKNAVAEIMIDGINILIDGLPKDKPPQPEDMTFDKVRKMLAESKWSSEVNKFSLRNGDVKIIISKGKVPLSFEKITADLTNIHLSPDKKWQLADVKVTSLLQGQGKMSLQGQLQPLAKPAMTDLNFSIVDFEVKTLNGLLLTVLPLDITSGRFSTYIEAASEKGYSNGYVKIFLDDIDVVSNPQKFKSGRHFVIEAATAVGNFVLKNSEKKSVAMDLPFKIKHDDVVVNNSDAFWSVIENKQEGLERKLDNEVSFAQNRTENSLE
jgi:hypothetical protein